MASATTFADLNLPETILSAVTDLGFTSPTAIQEQAIPLLLEGRDVLGVAQTGTGKTAAFALPMLAHVDPNNRHVQALVLAPTRELALQGAEAINTFAARTGGLDVVAVYGGSAYGPQLGALRDGAQVVVGTPGRVMDMIDRGALDLSTIRYFVLDEADEMLRMGFAEDVEKIATGLPEERISALFSATMPKQIRMVAETHLNNPAEVQVSSPSSTVDTITQTYAVVPTRHKIGALARVLATTEADAALVFVRTRATAEDLAIELSTRGVQAAALSGDVAQKDREKLVDRLRQGSIDVLVATDVAARGLDVERIGLVVNFDIPREVETYVHRIGRTGRAGREGTALSFVTPKEKQRLRRIEKVTRTQMTQVELPTPAEVSGLRARKLLAEAVERHAVGRLHVYDDLIAEFIAAQEDAQNDGMELLSLADLVSALLALGVRDPGPQATDEPEKLTVGFTADDDRREKRGRREDRGGQRRGGFDEPGTTYRVEVGRRDGVAPGAIVGAMTNEGGLRGSQLGKIDIFPSFSLIHVNDELDQATLRRIAKARVSGRTLDITKDNGPRGGRRPSEAHADDSGLRKYRADRKFGEERAQRRQTHSNRRGSFKKSYRKDNRRSFRDSY
ncbi:Cold-shock DEAD box protein A [Arcanobacterium haemolyticum]|uniref:DEAD/DEAH box helicase n=1 Tax=Arcanobacterium haemolyticum TaxID=28264 RepID=UPI000D8E024D|nr:DEAD/DEAH box helicase [Arcanobacterium haemolyticum]SPT74462.1 Cold-shock DEAD box protein A [Arcanobacterium haemolyticum]